MKNYHLFAHKGLVLLSFLALPLMLFVPFSLGYAMGAVLLYYFFFMFGMFIGNHKYWTHQSFEAGPVAETVMLTASILGVQGHPLYWGKGHLNHHDTALVDTDEDPIYRARKSGNPFKAVFSNHGDGYTSDDDFSFAKRILKNPRARFFHKIDVLSFLYPLALSLISLQALVYLWAIPVALSIFVCGCGVIQGHDRKSGYVTYDLDDSVNLRGFLYNLFYCGGGLENNHHKDPDSPNFAHSKNEFDLSYPFVRLLERRKVKKYERIT